LIRARRQARPAKRNSPSSARRFTAGTFSRAKSAGEGKARAGGFANTRSHAESSDEEPVNEMLDIELGSDQSIRIDRYDLSARS
jgi:hypothetical protein